ncbi:hypothetical protein MNBD_GAMMA09-1375 [hydrothermal vent metagenome]|uniref:Uncharacterized protein n=1 Tax=hydrothermal vent metagenome TaxID=652676 RepID=A0A3B0XI26_9ZZZZ
MVPLQSRAYTGVDRRASVDRRRVRDRRSPYRADAVNNERRIKSCRRKEDALWQN